MKSSSTATGLSPVRARTTSDYSKAFTRIRAVVATLPVESVVLDGEAIVLRPKGSQRRSWSLTI
jgi:ATP-dependent DNA ligase